MAKHERPGVVAGDFEPATHPARDLSGDYTVDVAHTRIGVLARHAMVTTVRGVFSDFSGAVHLDTADPPASTVVLRITSGSIDTGVPVRDRHLRSADFLDVERHPAIVFASTSVSAFSDESFRVTGDLTISDLTRSVDVDFQLTGSSTDPFGNERVGFEGAATLRRSEWGIEWNAGLTSGGVLVSDLIQLEFDVSAVRQVTAVPRVQSLPPVPPRRSAPDVPTPRSGSHDGLVTLGDRAVRRPPERAPAPRWWHWSRWTRVAPSSP